MGISFEYSSFSITLHFEVSIHDIFVNSIFSVYSDSTGSVNLTVDDVTPYSLHLRWEESDGDGLTGFTLRYVQVNKTDNIADQEVSTIIIIILILRDLYYP